MCTTALSCFPTVAKGDTVYVRRSEKRRLFRLFAAGKTAEQAAETLNGSNNNPAGARIDTSTAEKLLEEYLVLPLGEKLRLTLMADCVSNRLHRLVDDICDLTRIDTLLAEADKKDLASLLDIKRKIKERMAKEHAPHSEEQPERPDEELEHETDRRYEKIFGSPPPDDVRVRREHPLDGAAS